MTCDTNLVVLAGPNDYLQYYPRANRRSNPNNMNQFAGQGPPIDEETRWHQNNQAVVDLHEQAIVHLLGDDEYVALRMWRDALRSIESFTQGFFPDGGSLVTGATMTEAASLSDNHGERVAVADTPLPATDFLQEMTTPTIDSQSDTVLPRTFFSLRRSLAGEETLSASQASDILAVIVIYHIALSLHRVGIRSGFQHLLDESRSFYELAYSAVSHAELLLSVTDMEILSRSILDNISALNTMSKTASLA
jgi:hypothetical protein